MPELYVKDIPTVNKILSHHDDLILDVLEDIMLNHITIHDALTKIKKIVNNDPEDELKNIEEQFIKTKDIKEGIIKLTSFLCSYSHTEKIGNPIKELFTKVLKKILVYCSHHRKQLIYAYDFWHKYMISKIIEIKDIHWLLSFMNEYSFKQKYFKFDSQLINFINPKLSRDNIYLLKKLIREFPLHSQKENKDNNQDESEEEEEEEDKEHEEKNDHKDKNKKYIEKNTLLNIPLPLKEKDEYFKFIPYNSVCYFNYNTYDKAYTIDENKKDIEKNTLINIPIPLKEKDEQINNNYNFFNL